MRISIEGDGEKYSYDFTPRESEFRGALEYTDPEQRERERELAERKGKRRDTRLWDEWKMKIHDSFVESPKDDKPQSDNPSRDEGSRTDNDNEEGPSHRLSSSTGGVPMRAWSSPYIKDADRNTKDDNASRSSNVRWNKLRFLLPYLAPSAQKEPTSSAVVPSGVNITDELITGGLSTLMLRLWFERDEKGRRRVPVLFHRLRIRISDSLHPMHGIQSVFRIECEYANGAARWVIYRQLRDFISLHAHYTVSSAYNRNVETLPEFPRTSLYYAHCFTWSMVYISVGLPYFKFLKKESREKGGEVGRVEFARMQREALENYLIGMIRAIVSNKIHPLFQESLFTRFEDVSSCSESPRWILGDKCTFYLTRTVRRYTI